MQESFAAVCRRRLRTSILLLFNAQWVSNFLVSQTFPMMMDNPYLLERFHGGFLFWFYRDMCGLTIIFVWKWVPETKGKKLEEIEILWQKKSHGWKKSLLRGKR